MQYMDGIRINKYNSFALHCIQTKASKCKLMAVISVIGKLF